jgi:quercetin dioxygenase-like cupin family protein
MSEATLIPTTTAGVIQPDEAHVVRAFGSEIAFMLTGEQTGGALTIGLATIPPGGGPPPHVQAEDEVFLVVEGRYSFMVEGEWTEAGPGALVWLPRGTVHTFRNVGDTPARHWGITTPSGFERFFADAQALFSAPGGPDPARIVALAAEHGSRFV